MQPRTMLGLSTAVALAIGVAASLSLLTTPALPALASPAPLPAAASFAQQRLGVAANRADVDARIPDARNGVASTDDVTPSARITVFMPALAKLWPPIPFDPIIKPIDNADHDSGYAVTWNSALLATSYVVQEASEPGFAQSRTWPAVYNGPDLSLFLQAKTPGTYYYRVMARNTYGDSRWSAVASVTIYQFFVGMHARWDGVGQIRGTESIDYGWHDDRAVTGLRDPDTVKLHRSFWYDPNPLDVAGDTSDMYFNVFTSEFEGFSVNEPDDPSLRWDYPWYVGPASAPFQNGQVRHIGNQPFAVSGPHTQASFGRHIQYWQLVNQSQILTRHDGDWKSYIDPGKAILWIDTSNSRLLVRDDVEYAYYYKDERTPETEHIVGDLTTGNVFAPALWAAQALAVPMSSRPERRPGIEALPPGHPALLRRASLR